MLTHCVNVYWLAVCCINMVHRKTSLNQQHFTHRSKTHTFEVFEFLSFNLQGVCSQLCKLYLALEHRNWNFFSSSYQISVHFDMQRLHDQSQLRDWFSTRNSLQYIWNRFFFLLTKLLIQWPFYICLADPNKNSKPTRNS